MKGMLAMVIIVSISTNVYLQAVLQEVFVLPTVSASTPLHHMNVFVYLDSRVITHALISMSVPLIIMCVMNLQYVKIPVEVISATAKKVTKMQHRHVLHSTHRHQMAMNASKITNVEIVSIHVLQTQTVLIPWQVSSVTAMRVGSGVMTHVLMSMSVMIVHTAVTKILNVKITLVVMNANAILGTI